MQKPKEHAETVSVIIPVYNGERYLAEAIQSIVTQAPLPNEIIIVDDGSTDGSASVVTTLAVSSPVAIRYVLQPNQGPSAARNHGLRLATGALIAFIDADDLWGQDKLAKGMAYLRENPDVLIIRGLVQMFEVIDTRVVPIDQPCQGVLLGCHLFRREVFDIVGSFDESMRLGEDLDWYLRASEHGIKNPVLMQTSLWYRKHDTNIWFGRKHPKNTAMSVIKKHLDRMRSKS